MQGTQLGGEPTTIGMADLKPETYLLRYHYQLDAT